VKRHSNRGSQTPGKKENGKGEGKGLRESDKMARKSSNVKKKGKGTDVKVEEHLRAHLSEKRRKRSRK